MGKLDIRPPPEAVRRPSESGTQVLLEPHDDSVSMLEIVQTAARAAFRKAQRGDGTLDVEMAARAAQIAEKALSYTNPKLQAIAVKTTSDSEGKQETTLTVEFVDADTSGPELVSLPVH